MKFDLKVKVTVDAAKTIAAVTGLVIVLAKIFGYL